MKLGDPEGRLIPLDESVGAKIRLVAGNLGNLVLDRLAGFSAELKLATGLDATSPFGPRETEYLRITGVIEHRPKQ